VKERDELYTPSAGMDEKIREQILDETFKKAEKTYKHRSSDKEKSNQIGKVKTFPRLGILLIVFALLILIIINISPWLYVKYDANFGEMDVFFNKNLNSGDIEHTAILDLFESPYYLGLSAADFANTYTSVFNGVLILLILGSAITIFGAIDKFRDFSAENFIIIHFIFAIAAIITFIFIVLSMMKFLGGYLLLFHNMALIKESGPNLDIMVFTFPTAFMLTVLGVIIIKVMFTIIRIDFNGLLKIVETDTSELSFSHYTVGGKI
jgi:hypothetical protein